MKTFFEKILYFLRSLPERFKQSSVYALLIKIKDSFSNLWKKTKIFLKTTVKFSPPSKEKVVSFVLHWWHWVLGGIFALLILYYPVGALLIHRIDTNLNFVPASSVAFPEAPKTVTTLASLIDREINKHVWTPNLPFIFPSALLDNMPNYQLGIMAEVQRITRVLSVQNPDSKELAEASELLNYPGTIWYLSSWKPAVSSRTKYQAARYDLLRYAENVSEEKETFRNDKDALNSLILSLSASIKENTFVIKKHVEKYEKRLFDMRADDIFYNIQGHAYVYYVTLKAIEQDYKSILEEDQIKVLWQDMLSSLKQALMIQPLLVMNGSPETQFAPNHLLGIGFYLASSRTALQEILFILN